MLFSPVGAQKPLRIQGCFVSDSEIESVVDFVKNSRSVIYDDSIAQEIERSAVEGSKSSDSGSNDDEGSGDPMMNRPLSALLKRARPPQRFCSADCVSATPARAVSSMRWNRWVLWVRTRGSKPRQVLITYAQWLEMNMQKAGYPVMRNTKSAVHGRQKACAKAPRWYLFCFFWRSSLHAARTGDDGRSSARMRPAAVWTELARCRFDGLCHRRG